MPTVERSRLPGGLRVTAVELPHLHVATAALFVKVGSRFESPEDNGLSHFVEHMLHRGSERYPSSLALNTAIERLGGTLHAETGRDYSLFQTPAEPAAIPEAAAILGDLLARPRFSDIELERDLILEELSEDYDESDVEVNADDISRGLLFAGHPLGQRIIGPRANVEAFTEDDVRRHFARFYGATNALFCVAGPVAAADAIRAAHAAFADFPAGREAETEPVDSTLEPAHDHAAYTFVPDSGSQTSLNLGFRGVGELDDDYTAQVALLRTLDDGMSTRLHYQLADQKGLAYSINAAIEPLFDCSVFEVASATGHGKVVELVRETLALLGSYRDELVSEDELDKARRRYRLDLLASTDDPAAMAAHFGGTALYFEPEPLEARLAAIEAITPADVQRVARRIFRPERLAVAAVGSLSKARQGELRELVTGWR